MCVCVCVYVCMCIYACVYVHLCVGVCVQGDAPTMTVLV